MTSLDFLTILSTLDSSLERITINTKKYGNTTSWTKTTNFTVTYNDGESTTITDCTRICLLEKDNAIKVYVNHHNRHKLTSLTLSDLTSFTIT